MNVKYFLDTNILVYAYDDNEPDKKMTAQTILENGMKDENVVMSTQVLGEFFNVVTKQIQQPLTAVEAEGILRALSFMPVIDISISSVWRAIDVHRQYQTEYWDSLILSTAEQAGCEIVYSEDFNHNQKYNGVQVINPFA